MRKLFQVIVFLLMAFFANAQIVFKVKLSDAKSMHPISGASVLVNDKHYLMSDEDGFLQIAAKNLPVKIKVTATGFLTKNLELKNAETIVNVELEPVLFLLQPVEVTAIRAGDKAPFTKTDINKSYIEKNNLGQDIPFVLNQIPNTVINSDAGNGVGYTAIKIRGTDGSRINTTINGIPYNDAESQGTYFVDLPDFASSVNSMQVQRGVGTSSNGAGAFGATLNFSTNEYNDKPSIELNNSFGSYNTIKNTLKMSTGLLYKHFTLDARYSNIRSEGYVQRASSRLESGFFSAAYWGKKTTVRLNVILGKEKTYQSWYGIDSATLISDRTYNPAGTEKLGDPYNNQTDNYWQNHYQLFLNQELGKNWFFNTAFFFSKGYGYYEEYKADKTLADYNLEDIHLGNNVFTKSDLVRRLWLDNSYFGQIFSLQKKQKNDELNFGGGWNKYLGEHYGEVVWVKLSPGAYSKYYDLPAIKTDINFYAKWQHNFTKNITGFADAQYRFVEYKINGFQYNPTIFTDSKYHFFNPKIGASFRQKNWSGFVSYAIANKEPNRDDFEAGELQQPKSEQLQDLELNTKRKDIVKGLDASATFYFMNYKNQLILTGKINDVGAYTRTNVPNSFRLGTEWELNYHQQKWNAAYNISLSQNKIKNYTEFVDDYDNGGQQSFARGNTDIAFSPNIVQAFTLNYLPEKNVELSWIAKQVGRQYLDNTSSNLRSLKPFATNTFRASYGFSAKHIKDAKIIFQLNNIFNVKYEPNGYTYSYISSGMYQYGNYYYPMAGTNFMLGVNIKL